jgi:hypothetical protein
MDTQSTDPIPQHIYDIHQSLVEEEVITHPEIVKCSKEWINKLEKDLPNPYKSKRLKRCHYVNHCPICNHLREQEVDWKMNPHRQVLLDNSGKNVLMTFNLRHNNKSSLKHLQYVLKDSINKLKDDNVWKRKLFPSKYRLYVKTEYEISWSEDNGFHPHCHLQIGTTNPMPIDEMKSLIANAWKRIVTRVSPNKYFIPNLTNGVDVTESKSGGHSKDKDPYEDAVNRLHKKSVEEMKNKFKDFKYDTAAKVRKEGSYSLMQMQSNLNDIFIPLLKEYYNKTVKSFRRVFVNLNSHHSLFRKTTPILK